jgi:hypothetical protein
MGSSSSPIAQPVSISDLVKDVASELRTLKNSPPRRGEEVMTLSECEIELSVGARWRPLAGSSTWSVGGSTSASHRISSVLGVWCGLRCEIGLRLHPFDNDARGRCAETRFELKQGAASRLRCRSQYGTPKHALGCEVVDLTSRVR